MRITLKEVVELLLDMTEKGCTKEELARVIDHSRALLDGDWSISRMEDIQILQEKYSNKEA